MFVRAYDVYDLAEKQLKAFTRSKVRTKVMLCLMDGDKKVAEIEEMIGIRATTILHAIKDMSDAGFISKTANGYTLTSIGRMQTLLLDELVNSIVLLDQHRNFWLTHDISGVPDELLTKIGMLGQSEIISADHAELLRSHERFVTELMKARHIRGVSPIFIPDYPEMIAAAVNGGAEVSLVVTGPILDLIIADHYRLLNDLISQKNFRLYKLDREITIAFAVTDTMLSLGLFRDDGVYDLGKDLICIGESAIEWGMELFEYYRRMSDLVKRI
jgi:predicted transcriptional regulator